MWRWLREILNGERGADTLARRGEDAAARFLRSLGYKILIRNFRCAAGEIDIIARDGKELVFVEVKTRVSAEPPPEDAVNRAKQHQITKAARVFLSRYGTPQPPARFDVIGIVWPRGREPQVTHTQDAFAASF